MVQMACLLQPRDGRSRSGAEELMENGGARWTYGMRNLQPNQPTYQPLCCAMHSMSSNPPQGGPPLDRKHVESSTRLEKAGRSSWFCEPADPPGRFANRFQLE